MKSQTSACKSYILYYNIST